MSGAKDGSVCISQIAESQLKKTDTFDISEEVVKCVRWNSIDHNLFGVTGNDMLVKIVDKRQKKDVISIAKLHQNVINSIRWHPADEHILVTCSFDTKIQMCDIRKPNAPLHTLTGWCDPKVVKHSSIFHPLFTQNGKALAINGEKSQHLTLFDTKTATIVRV